MATSQTGSTADVDACSDNELVDVENHKNEARFTFSQIHQYLQYGTYPSDFQKSDKQALRKRSKFFKSADGNLYYVGGCKLAVAICLLPQHLLSVLYFILHAARPKIGALVRERLVVEDPDRRKRIVASIHDTSHMGLNRTTDMVSGKYYWPGLTSDVKAYVSSLTLYALHLPMCM